MLPSTNIIIGKRNHSVVLYLNQTSYASQHTSSTTKTHTLEFMTLMQLTNKKHILTWQKEAKRENMKRAAYEILHIVFTKSKRMKNLPELMFASKAQQEQKWG